jgi:hypothetical protein
MNFGSAIFLSFVVFLVVEMARELIYGDNTGRIKLAVAIVVANVMTPVVAHSSWANSQVIEGVKLGTMGWQDQVIVALGLAGLAALTVKIGVKAVSNIGQNRSPS